MVLRQLARVSTPHEGGGEVKYRYTIVNEGVVEAENKAEAEAAAFQSCDEGRGVFGCEVELLVREVEE